ncbi:hypothetical protein YC2023_016050 [Brassica napus]
MEDKAVWLGFHLQILTSRLLCTGSCFRYGSGGSPISRPSVMLLPVLCGGVSALGHVTFEWRCYDACSSLVKASTRISYGKYVNGMVSEEKEGCRVHVKKKLVKEGDNNEIGDDDCSKEDNISYLIVLRPKMRKNKPN